MKVNNSPFVGKMNQAKRQKKIPKHLNEYVLRTKEHSKHSDQAESNMEYSDEGDENITFIPPKPKKAKQRTRLQRYNINIPIINHCYHIKLP